MLAYINNKYEPISIPYNYKRTNNILYCGVKMILFAGTAKLLLLLLEILAKLKFSPK